MIPNPIQFKTLELPGKVAVSCLTSTMAIVWFSLVSLLARKSFFLVKKFCYFLWVFCILFNINCHGKFQWVFLAGGFCRTLKIGNKTYSLQPLIGCPFGSLFQVENGDQGQCLARFVPTLEGLVLKSLPFDLLSLIL